MCEADAQAVLGVQRVAYPATHWESWEVLGRKLALWPQGCWVSVDAGGDVQAYLFSHPGRAEAPPALHGVIDALPTAPDAYAVHDLALHPRAQGRGLGVALWRRAQVAAHAAGLTVITLVAVQGSAGFWARQGFATVQPESPDMVRKLAGYGADAAFMRQG